MRKRAKKKAPRKMGTKGRINPERLKVVATMMRRALDVSTIDHRLSEEWGTSLRTIYNYRKTVERIWRENHEATDPTMDAATLRQQLDDIYFEARGGGKKGDPGYRQPDLRTCNQILRTKASVFLPQKHEVSGPGGGAIPVVAKVDLTGLSDEELETLERLSGKIGLGEDDAGPGEGGDPR